MIFLYLRSLFLGDIITRTFFKLGFVEKLWRKFMNVKILFVVIREIDRKREVVLIVRGGAFELKLVVKQRYISDLFSEFKINRIY